jgi:BirA family transcriptional regulator, biotin operon repressor / biotin---[acetyl-CoA-carboxylase] ligase
MSTLNYPTILTDLGHVGANGLPLSSATWFQHEMELCKEWGFRFEIVNGRVHLNFDQEQLIPYWIQKETPAIAWDWLRVKGFLRAGSTNGEAMEMARNGAAGGTLVFAEEQTDGKGRKGRSWFSPAQKGLYFTLILRPGQPRKSWPLLTHVTSVALAETLRNLAVDGIIPHPLDVDIKWPNDVLISGKKCAGILLETASTDEGNPAAVVGLGINVHEGSVPEFLESEAVCLDEMAQTFVPRRQLMVRFLHQFQLCYLLFENGNQKEILRRWKSLSSMWNGIPIWITEGEIRRAGVTCGLNEIGALLVRTTEGKTETIFAGDISVRRNLDS